MDKNDILKSLANLEQSLKDIDSARKQVSEVIKSSEKLADEAKQQVAEAIQYSELLVSDAIESSQNQVTEVVQSSGKLADVIASYKSSFEGISSNIEQVLDKSKDLTLNVLSELSKQTGNLRDEIVKFSEIDFDAKFQTLQKEVVKQFEKDLLTRLIVIDKKAQDLQVKIGEFKDQISRLESVDLEKHFDRHQEMLSKVFGAINAINLTLSAITQFTSINQSLENIDTSQKELFIRIDKHDKDLKTIETGQAVILNHLANLQKAILEEIETTHDENISMYYELRKGIKINRVIIICGVIFLIVVLAGITLGGNFFKF